MKTAKGSYVRRTTSWGFPLLCDEIEIRDHIISDTQNDKNDARVRDAESVVIDPAFFQQGRSVAIQGYIKPNRGKGGFSVKGLIPAYVGSAGPIAAVAAKVAGCLGGNLCGIIYTPSRDGDKPAGYIYPIGARPPHEIGGWTIVVRARVMAKKGGKYFDSASVCLGDIGIPAPGHGPEVAVRRLGENKNGELNALIDAIRIGRAAEIAKRAGPIGPVILRIATWGIGRVKVKV